MTQCKALNFADLVEKVLSSQNPPSEGWPKIVGGECQSASLPDWLAGQENLVDLDMRIWCYTDHCEIGKCKTLKQVALLEHARLFGKGGDLEIWRSGQYFRWRYVGLTKYAPEGEELTWPSKPTKPVFYRECKALLWGNRPAGKDLWHDDRVAGAALTYLKTKSPTDNVPERMRVTYREYTQAGRPFAVWFTGLEGYNG